MPLKYAMFIFYLTLLFYTTITILSIARRRNIISNLSYKDAGVDINAGDALVEAIKPLAKSTDRPGAVSDLGGFGALFDLKMAGYKDPILVSSTDGVGTKLKVATTVNVHNTVGIDLVAMCVNDLIAQGAEPLFFLDYFSTGELKTAHAKDIIAGIAEGCRQAGCALVGGETAEMPGMYASGDYDLAGFAVGAIERNNIIGTKITVGDVVLGIRSNGLHSNGFSLVRKIIETNGISYIDRAPFNRDNPLSEILLTPTRIYVKSCLSVIRAKTIKALAHITGGGLSGNIPRVLPKGLGARLDATTWTPDPIFKWLAKTGNITPMEMIRTFNCGIGMIVICAPDCVTETKHLLEENGERTVIIGKIEQRNNVLIGEIEKIWQN